MKNNKSKLTKQTVAPNDIDISNYLIGSTLETAERETIAYRIIISSRQNDNRWLDFTWEEYQLKYIRKVANWKERKEREVMERREERKILNEFVQEGLLKCENGIYLIQNAFVQKLEKFVQIKEDQ